MRIKDLVLGKIYIEVQRPKSYLKIIRGGFLGLQKIGISHHMRDDGTRYTMSHKIYDNQLREYTDDDLKDNAQNRLSYAVHNN